MGNRHRAAIVLAVGRAPSPAQRRAGLRRRVGLRGCEPGHLAGLGIALAPPHLGDDRRHSGLLMAQLAVLRPQHLQDPVVGHPREIHPSQGGGEPRPGRQLRQALGHLRRRHGSNIRATTDRTGQPRPRTGYASPNGGSSPCSGPRPLCNSASSCLDPPGDGRPALSKTRRLQCSGGSKAPRHPAGRVAGRTDTAPTGRIR